MANVRVSALKPDTGHRRAIRRDGKGSGADGYPGHSSSWKYSCGTLSSALKVTFICPSCAGGSGFVFDGINDNKWHTKQESKLIKEDVLE